MTHRIIAGLLLLLASAALASPTAPDLHIEDASVLGMGEVRQLRIEGRFHFDDLVQVAYPFQLVAYTDGGHYVRYDLSGTAYTGVEPALGSHLDLKDATILLSSGDEAPDAGVVAITKTTLDLSLPASLPPGRVTVQIFVEDQGRIVFSNARTAREDAP